MYIRYYGDKYKNYLGAASKDNAGVLQRQILLKDTIKKYYDTYSYGDQLVYTSHKKFCKLFDLKSDLISPFKTRCIRNSLT